MQQKQTVKNAYTVGWTFNRSIPGLFTDTSAHIRFFLLFSSSFFHFLVVGSGRAVD